MIQATTLGVWELDDEAHEEIPRSVSVRRTESAPSYSAVVLDDQIDRLDLLLEAGARPSLDPETWYYVDGMGLCRLERHDAYAAVGGQRFVLRLEVCNPCGGLQ
jgi:hypothetical protein